VVSEGGGGDRGVQVVGVDAQGDAAVRLAEVGAELFGPLVDGPQAVSDASPPGEGLVQVVAGDPERVRPGIAGRAVNAREVRRTQVEVLVDT
jgi:hypothetical protein